MKSVLFGGERDKWIKSGDDNCLVVTINHNNSHNILSNDGLYMFS